MRRTNPYAVASLVCGLLWACGIGSLLAVFFGHLARRQVRATGERGRIPALLGLILGYTGLFLAVLFFLQGGVLIVA
ncbi:DUF4190 domain-containing protein [Actinocorallia populi]|uniref:DUF4190 domain-containing protein n=1 Tax=Actinocorallia populi TaxID=2079200 RepID=UPI00130092E3|nr:DUF4190 domain-containing protein [Actinocorallia populi]